MDQDTLLIKIEELLDRKLEEKLEEKLEQKLDEKLDKKLDEKLQPIYERLTSVEEDLTSVKKTCFRVENEIIPEVNALYEDRISHSEFNRLSEQVDNHTRMLSVMQDVIISHSGEISCLKEVK